MKSMIIIPTYNEKDNIPDLVKEILSLNRGFFITFVDDNSPDGTGEIADELSKRYKEISVIHRPKKMGLGSAYVEGFKYALDQGADYIFEMDADFSHNPKYLFEMLKQVKDYDVVIGSRYINGVRVEGWRFRRLLLSKLANIFVSYLLIKPVWDFTTGFRCYRRKVIESIDLDEIKSDGYAFQIEMTHLSFKNGFKIKEIPITFMERNGGYSKISRDVILESFIIALKLRAPLLKILRHAKYLFKNYNGFVNDYYNKTHNNDLH